MVEIDSVSDFFTLKTKDNNEKFSFCLSFF